TSQWLKFATQRCESTNEFEQLLFIFSATPGGEGVSFVAWKSAGEVASRCRFVTAFQRDLIAVIKLRHAARRQHKRIRQFEACDRRALLAHETAIIVSA